MTAQVRDSVEYGGTRWVLVEAQGHGLFEPGQVGVRARKFMSACWRGYVCSYTVADGGLYLERLVIGLEEEQLRSAAESGSPFLAGTPTRNTKYAYTFSGMHAPVPFSGRLFLLAAGAAQAPRADSGMPEPAEHEHITELNFQSGHLTSAAHGSDVMASRNPAESNGDGGRLQL